ncbi:hypothetical protein [Arthrobacter sp. MYb213]|uniref:hypothetical protein n=1 Tax=Arthrobacter sp. MYb213 TaxID=1848595 RepID=UPI000CFB4FA7|nr:hypothetical protein [Arthrobacter sp. MYb213]PRB71238.1 hypothetical protein CQ011_04835 [Arthrobacter sp. MYb213]
MREQRANQPLTVGSNLSALVRGLVAAVVSGLLGTAIHASLSYAGNIPLVWGVLVAWLLLGLLVYWSVVASGKLWAGAVGFIGCYLVVGSISYFGNDTMILPLQYLQYLPGPTIASLLWMYGMIVPAVISLFMALRVLRKRQR